MSCEEGFYLDKITFKCVSVSNDGFIENCKYYQLPKVCSVC